MKKEPITSNLVVLLLAANLGMRQGEILTLNWKYIDLNPKMSFIEITYSYSKNKELVSPKTEKSRRKIVLDSFTREYLSQWKSIQTEYFKILSKRHSGITPVCTDMRGNRIDLDNFGRWRRGYFAKLGIGTYTKSEQYITKGGETRTKNSDYVGPGLHSLRHFHATTLLAAGLDPDTVQQMLGDEKIATTLEIYAEALPEKDVEAANCIDDLIKDLS